MGFVRVLVSGETCKGEVKVMCVAKSTRWSRAFILGWDLEEKACRRMIVRSRKLEM